VPPCGLAGLSLLQIQDEAGSHRELGHFRNEYDRSDPALPRLLAAAPAGTALVEARTAESAVPSAGAGRIPSGSAAGRFTLVGGMAWTRVFLARLTPESELNGDGGTPVRHGLRHDQPPKS